MLEWIKKAKEDSEGLNPDIRWEFIKMRIRDRSIKFAKRLEKETRYLEAEQETRLFTRDKELVF